MPEPLLFDPRQVPVLGTDAHLPKVKPQALLVSALVQRFQNQPLCGTQPSSPSKFTTHAVVPAAVLIPLVMRERLMVLMTERAQQLSSHPGQVAFPGGRADPTDTDAIATALREAQEEIGLASHFIQVLGCLPEHATSSAFLVTPVVALVRGDCELRPNPQEVADIFEVPLAFLMDPANHRHHVARLNGMLREWISIPYKDVDKERFIWGASAAMVRDLYQFVRAGDSVGDDQL